MIRLPERPATPNGRLASTPPALGPVQARWRTPRWRMATLGLLLLIGLGTALVVKLSAPPSSPVVLSTPYSAALVAHGQIVPAQQAHVGSLGGGVVRELTVATGAQVGGGTGLAWVDGPSGTEVLTAPFGGTVTNVLVHAGDTVLPGATLVVVADLRTLQVETNDVDQFLVGHLHVGQPLRITIDALDNRPVRGTVKTVAQQPQTDAAGGHSYAVTIAVPDLPAGVQAGMTTRVIVLESQTAR